MENDPEKQKEIDKKIAIIKLLEAKQKLTQDQVLYNFLPSPIQRLVLLSKEKIVLVLGANRSGKSECLTADALIRSTGVVPKAIEHEYPQEFIRHGGYWLSALSYKSMRDVIQEKLDKIMPKRLVTQHRKDDQIYFLQCGCKIGLKSMEAGWESYTGASRLYFGCDEEHDEKVYNEGYMRTIDCGGIVRMGFTPLKGLTWAYKELYLKASKYYYTVNKHGISEEVGMVHTPEEIALLKDREVRFRINSSNEADSDIVIFQMSIYDNVHLPNIEIHRTERKYSDDPVNYNARILGNFAKFTGREVFDRRITDKYMRMVKNDFAKGDVVNGKFIPSGKGKLILFKPMEWIKNRHFVIGADLSEGLETGDPSCAQILDHRTFEQVGVWHGKAPMEELSRILVELAKFFNNAWLAPERNFHGIGIVNRIRDHFKYPYLYCEYDIPSHIVNQTVKGGNVKKYGWDTNAKTKPVMIQELASAMRDGRIHIFDANTLDEIQTFIFHDNGKMGSMTGCYDDRVIALAIALQCGMRRTIKVSQNSSYIEPVHDQYTGY